LTVFGRLHTRTAADHILSWSKSHTAHTKKSVPLLLLLPIRILYIKGGVLPAGVTATAYRQQQTRRLNTYRPRGIFIPKSYYTIVGETRSSGCGLGGIIFPNSYYSGINNPKYRLQSGNVMDIKSCYFRINYPKYRCTYEYSLKSSWRS